MASGGERELISDLESLSSLKLGRRSVDHQDTGLGSTAGTGQYTPSYARTRDMPTACMIRLVMSVDRAQRRIERPLDRIDEAEVSGNWRSLRTWGDVLDVDTDDIAAISYLWASRGNARYRPCNRHATVNRLDPVRSRIRDRVIWVSGWPCGLNDLSLRPSGLCTLTPAGEDAPDVRR